MQRQEKVEARLKRKKRMKNKIFGTPEKPRLCIYKSVKGIYAQIINDAEQKVITGVSTLNKDVKTEIKHGGNAEAAKTVGLAIGKKAITLGITRIVFDRNGFRYHGRVKALAEGAREAGLVF